MPSLSMLFCVFIVFFAAIFAGNAAAAPPPSQLSALSKFYVEMKGDTWTIGAGLVKWSFTSPGGIPDSSADVCKWVGVKCAATGDDVVGLLLDKMNLQGQLKAETLKLFPGLEALQLNGNGLTGPVPDLSAGMPALKYLELSSNKLIGPLPDKFPTTLIDLRLSSNPGVGGVFPASLSMAKNLVTVDLGNMGLTGPMPTDFFTKLPRLSTFSVANNKLEGNPLDTMGACSELTFVKLTGNLFKGSFPTTDSKLPMKMVNMDTFQIDQNSFTGSLPDELGSWSKLRVLSLNDNKFSGDVSKALANKKSLEQLFLQNNRPQDSECEATLLKVTSKFLQDRTSKTDAKPEATACASGFTGGLPPKIFTLMPKLKALDVSINSFLERLPTELQMMANLPSISFGGNRFYGPMPSFTLSSSAPKNDILQSIDFSNNYLEGENIDFSRLTSLRTLFLDGNFISGSFPVFSPSAKATLQTLHLSNRKGSSNLSPDASKDDLHLCLEGKYPVSMNAYAMLEQLEMYNHCLGGTLPAGINILANLVTLRLDSNKFTGQIPALDNLKGLLSLGLRFNDFSGTLPAKFSTLTKLKDLYINNNPKLGGTLPDLSGLVNLQAFDTSNCMFSGTLPANLFSRMTKLTNVNLALSKVPGVKTTGFEGIIPLETLLKFNKGLATIDFSNNMFTGVEPVKSSPSELTSLILASNQLTDDVKSIVGSASFPKLAQFDISGNSIIGDVPASFVKTSKRLTQVDMSTNKMTSVPSELFSISTLTLLRVDGNPKLQEQNGATINNIGANLKELRVGGTRLAIKTSSTFSDLQVFYADQLKSVTITSDLWKSTSLKFLMLDGSTLLPKPPSLVDLPDGEMSNLVELHMANTGLTWDFATANNWYCSSSSNLNILDLSDNSLQGTFPTWMLSEEDCPKQLYVIDLSKNTKFKSGLAMDPKATLKAALASLDISSTNRNGDLSQFVPATSSVLQSFKIAGNAFSGQIPDNWKTLGKEGGGLESLDLSSLPNVKGSFGLCDMTDRAESKVENKAKSATDLEIFVANDPSICYDPCWIDAKTKKLAEGFHADSSMKQCTTPLPTRQSTKQSPSPNDCPQVQSPSFSMTVAMTLTGVNSATLNADKTELRKAVVNVLSDKTTAFTFTCGMVQIGSSSALHSNIRERVLSDSAKVSVTITTPASGSADTLFKTYSDALQKDLLSQIKLLIPGVTSLSAAYTNISPSPAPTQAPATSSSNSSGSASSGEGGTLPIIGGAVGGIAVIAAIFAYWYFFMRKKEQTNVGEDSIPGFSRKLQRSTTMDNPMMSPTNRDSIPLFVPHTNQGGYPPLPSPASDPKRASTWDAPSHSHSMDNTHSADATNPMAYNQTNRLSTTQAVNNSVNAGALYSNAYGHGNGNARLSQGVNSSYPNTQGQSHNDDL